MVIDEWKSCYPSNWKGLIINQAMSHPAKFSSRLIRRIYEHVMSEGWVKKGDKVIDPFGGVALGALDAMRVGLDWTGGELEQKFVDLGGERFDCPGFTKQEWIRFYNRARNTNYKHNFHWCPECVEKFYKVEKAGIVPEALPHAFVGNIGMWNRKFSRMPNWGKARLLQGDSRKLLAVLGCDFMAVVGSPPYADGSQHTGGNDSHPEKGGQRFGVGIADAMSVQPYGETPGQLGAMPNSDFDLALGSPPYAEISQSGGTKGLKEHGTGLTQGEICFDKYGSTDGQLGAMPDSDFDLALCSPPFGSSQQVDNRKKPSSAMSTFWDNHMGFTTDGDNPGNLANLPDSDFDLALGSPPFMQSEGGTPEPKPGGSIDKALYARHAAGNAKANGYGTSEGQLSSMEDSKFSLALGSPPFERTGVPDHKGQTDSLKGGKFIGGGDGFLHKEYGDAPGNIGNDSGASFWLAAREIVDQVYAALRPGGHAVWVVKAYVKNKTYIDFPGQWRQLCEAAGFVTLHEHRALLVHHKGTQRTMDGKDKTYTTASKSFFRRLAERKAALNKYWKSLERITQFAYLMKSRYEMWRVYNLLSDIEKKALDSDGTLKNEPPNKSRTKSLAQHLAFVDSGEKEELWNRETRIDHETVYCMAKPTNSNGGGAHLAVGSPPYADSVNQGDGANDGAARTRRKVTSGVDVSKAVNRGGPNSVLNQPQAYGSTPGQLGAMKDSDFDLVVGSPPFERVVLHDGGPVRQQGGTLHSDYGTTPGQLGAMKDSGFDLVVGSPPYADSINSETHGIDFTKAAKDYPGRQMHDNRLEMMDRNHSMRKYGTTPGQLGAMKDSGFDRALDG